MSCVLFMPQVNYSLYLPTYVAHEKNTCQGHIQELAEKDGVEPGERHPRMAASLPALLAETQGSEMWKRSSMSSLQTHTVQFCELQCRRVRNFAQSGRVRIKLHVC